MRHDEHSDYSRISVEKNIWRNDLLVHVIEEFVVGMHGCDALGGFSFEGRDLVDDALNTQIPRSGISARNSHCEGLLPREAKLIRKPVE
jgi:hypothetical protein